MAGIFETIAKKYKTLSPELKIPAILLLYCLLIVNRFIETVVIVFKRLGFFIKNGLSIVKSKKRKIKRIYLTRFPKKRGAKKSIQFLSPLVKFKYFFLGIFFSTFFIFLPSLTVIFLQDLPNPQELSLQQIPQTTKIYDRNKVLLYEIYTDQNRTLVSLADIPKHLQNATLAIEDKNFYNHPGFDIASIIRALKENAINGKPIQGGSTITQQLIKSSFFTSEKKLSRKIKEIVLAYWTEHIYDKEQILEMYFNQVPYGGTAWGIEAASEVYFGKHVGKLSLAESAFLAGITQAPTTYSPYATNSRWKNRQKEVLSRMLSLGYITSGQKNKAETEILRFRKPAAPLLAPHFVMYVKDLLIQKHGLAAVERGGLNVITSLDIKKQDMAQKIVKSEVERNTYLNLNNGAALITDPKNGDILAMVGSKDYYDENGGNVNITTSLQQPGSTVKVITYSAAILKGLTPLSMINDSPTVFPGGTGSPPYSPVNYDGKYFGRVTMRFALANSLNLPAVKTLQRTGISNMVELGKKMGISTWNDPSDYGLSVTLGGFDTTMLDMATVFGTLSNKGIKSDLEPILLITDSKGKIIEKKENNLQENVLPSGVAYIISDILSDNQTRSAVFGPESKLLIPGRKISVKTGTTDNKRDNWTIGYSKDYVVTVWVGNNDNSPMNQALASGITGAAPIWHDVMVNLLGKTADPIEQVPSDVIARSCFGKIEYFFKGTENSVACGFNPRAKFYSSQQ